MGEPSKTSRLNVYTVVYTAYTLSGLSLNSLAFFVCEKGSFIGGLHSFPTDDTTSGHRHESYQKMTYEPTSPRFKGTHLKLTGTTPRETYPEQWNTLLDKLFAEQLSVKQNMEATSRESKEEGRMSAHLSCSRAQSMLIRHGILMPEGDDNGFDRLKQ
ncbi:uncharacterized protein N7500_010530 [Penicillium coprophilum]|uniref:uncharacterized protein n=1 Tax=Penicillium coprophilum TaxID=36646 RepID=UPI002396B012|nr:uncharacterized protein N7500_010530 [Penicillium coprophilum]KAJ5155091.1 hypothetical protein N7500_010530 [Penicillium coprophilum]